ncbi:UNVERIFIED_CONTAM: Calmodulin-binding protein 60 B [Sesamum radiatum]|uniref:Calmodulin-binding protein 60 B n=1 Tax=Sesamum radiatum TaxID=300843 RepID=A0AAW2KHS0_SESRA
MRCLKMKTCNICFVYLAWVGMDMVMVHASFNINENNYAYPAYTPMTPSTFGFDVDRTRPSGKAVVGWLKLKAALRWGIFIRKKAAERRAQIVELDDF